MVVSFNVTDADTGAPLSGTVVWSESGSTYYLPLLDGKLEVATSGSQDRLRKLYYVAVDGYVPVKGFFFFSGPKAVTVTMHRMRAQ